MNGGYRFGKYLKTTLLVGDFLILNLAYVLTVLITGAGTELVHKWVWLLVNLSFVPSAILFSDTHNDRILYADRVALNGFKSVVLQAVVFMTLLYLFDIFDVGLRVLLLFGCLFWLLLSIWWVFSRWLLKRFRRMGFNYKRCVIVGCGNTGRLVYNELRDDTGYGYRVFAFFSPNQEHEESIHSVQVLPLSEVEEFVKANRIDQIYYTLSAENQEMISKMMLLSEECGAQFVYVPSFNKVLTGQFQASTLGNMPAMTYAMSPLQQRTNQAAKRVFDLMISVPFLVVSPLIFIPIAIGIKLTSPGPVFFRQKRTGIRGSEFVCYKFRTMKVNAESDTLQATKDDPRKTKFGDFLRRSSLDELPQFFNVFLGNMSVVGPRPHMVSHTEQYSAVIDKYMVRHAVKPGITGWAQVNGYRGGTKHLWQMEKRVEYDVWYIRNWNLFLDIKIVFLTMFNAFRGESNAY